MMTDSVRQKVLEVYAAVDAAIAKAGPRCDASGRCCRFTEYGHTLFISQFEAEILLESRSTVCDTGSGGYLPLSDRRALHGAGRTAVGMSDYFCDPTYQDRMMEITEHSIAQLKQIADTFETGWHYARLHHFLNTAVRTAALPADTMTSPGSRFPLRLVGNET